MFHSTTILAIRHRDKAVIAGDGQVTLGDTIVKQGAKKIRRLYNNQILAGFAGSAADSFALFARFESKLEQYAGTSSGRRWSWPRTGARIARCAGSRRC
jgi:ATP-dependent HslUV protease subunit HslV